MRRNDTGLRPLGVLMRIEAVLTADETRHAARVRVALDAAIAGAGGWISFERFMEFVLYAPGIGYYSAGARKIGRGGDFVTAPEISSLFGACVARQCAEVLSAIGTAGSRAAIVEVGAGTGRLAVDVLLRLDSLEQLPARYCILDVSADLRQRQRDLIEEHAAHLAHLVDWIDAPPNGQFDGVVLGNEVLDALPVRRFRRRGVGFEELGVALVDGGLTWVTRTGDAALETACRRLSAGAGGWDEGYTSEYCPRLVPWAKSVTGCLRRGAALWFDYGLPRAQYYLPERRDGTLICHFRQRAHGDPLSLPGLQDISAWVDFTAVAEACAGAGWELAGFTTQAFFLAGLGIDGEMLVAAGGDDSRFARLAHEARRLMLPGEMGERFKVMAWTRGIEHALSGFRLQDLRHSLEPPS